MSFTATLPPAYQRLLTYYNGNPWDVALNPGGMDNNGHYYNFIPCCQDTAAMGAFAASMALVASQCAAGTNGWTTDTGSILFVSGSQFTSSGNKTVTYQKNRALMITHAGGTSYCYVVDAAYNGGTDKTTITILVSSGIGTVTGPISSVAYGQQVENAPSSPALASILFITQNFVTP